MKTIVCFGDSNTHGANAQTQARLPREVRWPGVVRTQLGPEYEVIEEGLNGRTTVFDHPATPFRTGSDYLLPCLWSHAPVDLLVLMLGTNDLKERYRLSAPDIAAGIGQLIELARSSLAGPDETPPAILLICPPPLGSVSARGDVWGFGGAAEESTRLGPLFRVVAEIRGVAFMDAGSVIESSPFDGVHLEPEAHRLLGSAIAQRVGEILAADRGR